MKELGSTVEDIYLQIKNNYHLVETDSYRNQFHLMPSVGLLNDPNGLIHFKRIYHVFYQWNPFETEQGVKCWGHYTTKDFIKWEMQPIALLPNNWYDCSGCYSGSAVKSDDTLYLFYTGNVKDENQKRSCYQCVAISKDGINFEKKGPVIFLPDGYTTHFRDPKVWKADELWYMIIGAQNDKEEGTVVLYQSDDLIKWEFIGPIAGSNLNGHGDLGYMWECPDMFKIDGIDILLVSPQGIVSEGIKYNNEFQSGYFIGKMDFAANKFEHGEFTELDRGFDFYAPQTMLDESGRRIMYGWMGMSDGMQKYQPTIKYKWIHALTIPRKLSLVNGRIYQEPLEELAQLRSSIIIESDIKFNQEQRELCIHDYKTMELKIKYNQAIKDEFQILIRDNVRIIYSALKNTFTVERKNFKDDKTEQRHCNLENLINLNIFIDASSIEIFINDGQEVFTCRFFAEDNEKDIVFLSKDEIEFHIIAWQLNQLIIENCIPELKI